MLEQRVKELLFPGIEKSEHELCVWGRVLESGFCIGQDEWRPEPPWVTNLCYYNLYDTEILKLSNILFLHLICILLKPWSLFRLLISLFQVSWWQTLFFQLLRLTWHLGIFIDFSHNSYLSIRDPAVSVCFSPHQCYPGGSCQFLLFRLLQLSAH